MVQFRILDVKTTKNGLEIDVEVPKDGNTGSDVLKLFNQNARKGTTIMINKSQKQEVKFVRFIATDIIKVLLDKFISGEGWNGLLKNISATDSTQTFSCTFCFLLV